MSTKLNPYLNFKGNAREAMEFYKTVFGGNLTMSTYKDFNSSQSPSEDNLIMHAVLKADSGIEFMAADVPSGMEYKAGTNFSMSIIGEDETELKGYFDKLCAGGTVQQPMEKASWGDSFGMCLDKFDVRWFVNISAAKG